MASLLQSTANTRAVLPGSFRFLRSDVPAQLTKAETDWLIAHQVQTIIDLRTGAEASKKPCPLAEDARFRYYRIPITGGNSIPATPKGVSESYIRMVDSQMSLILEKIQNAPTNVLFFCNAGKDRTGVVAAILQKAFGLSDAYILEDYLTSGENLRQALEGFANANPTVDLQVITPKREYMEEFLAWYHTNLP